MPSSDAAHEHDNSLYPTLELCNERPTALSHIAAILGATGGRSLVLVTGDAARDEILGLEEPLGRRIQLVCRVPAQRDRPEVSVVTYDHAYNIVVKNPYGHYQIDPASYSQIVAIDPHRLAYKTVRNTAAWCQGLALTVCATQPSRVERAFLREAFLGEIAPLHDDLRQTSPYEPARWQGTRKADQWWGKAACSSCVVSPGGEAYSVEFYREVRAQCCSSCPVADSCLSAGLRYESEVSSRGSLPPGAWGGLSSYARRQLAAELRRGVSPAAAAFLVEHARQT